MFKVWDERRVEGENSRLLELQYENEREPKWRLVRGTYKLVEDDDRKVWEGTCGLQGKGAQQHMERHRAKFREDRSKRSGDMADFRFSRWRPSAILDFQKV